ncbi:MAG: ATP-binding protein [Anaerolineaceae bacterium]|nr:ATP-binding protein [Anaerolineaceae bacterium]
MPASEPTFQNREKEVQQICGNGEQVVLWNIYGEMGIGKSRLLTQVAHELESRSPRARVLQVDMAGLAQVDRPVRSERILGDLLEVAQMQDRVNGQAQDLAAVMGQVIAELSAEARTRPVVLMFDTTEVVQEDMDFWSWMEENLVGPLAAEGKVQQIFAGRVPVPWRRFEVRRVLRPYQLGPLEEGTALANLVKEVLVEENPRLREDATLGDAVALILEFSFGHPALSQELAAYVARRWPLPDIQSFRQELCHEVVKLFIDDSLFKGIAPPWTRILEWTSILDWFDVTILQRYLQHLEPSIAQEPDHFFISGLDRLRFLNTVVWREMRGDRLHGIIRDIVRHCLEVMEPERYKEGCLAAATTMDAVADEFPADNLEANKYRAEAERYRQRVQEEGAHDFSIAG